MQWRECCMRFHHSLMQRKILSTLPHLQEKKKFRYHRWMHVILYPTVDCRGTEWLCYLNVNRNRWYVEYRSMLWYTISTAASDFQLDWKAFVKWCELENSARIERFVVIQVLEWDRTKAELIDFSKPSLSQSAYCLLPLKTLLSILHDLPSQSSPLWHAAISAVAQGIVSTFSTQKKKTLSPSTAPLCVVVRHLRGKQFRLCPLLTISLMSQ